MLFKFVIDLAFKLFYTVQPMSLIYVNCEAYVLIHIHLVLLTDYTRTMSISFLAPKNIISPVVMKMLCEFSVNLLFIYLLNREVSLLRSIPVNLLFIWWWNRSNNYWAYPNYSWPTSDLTQLYMFLYKC